MRILSNDEMTSIVYDKVFFRLMDVQKEAVNDDVDKKELFEAAFKNDWLIKEIVKLSVSEYVDSLKRGEHIKFNIED